jgi:DNA (cytosine-5)-methyltransferase 1
MPAVDIRAMRERAGLSRADLAQQIGYAVKSVQRWEEGKSVPRPLIAEKILNVLESRPLVRPITAPQFTFIDLFAGIVGLRRGFEAAGGECIFTSECDKYAQQTYRANFGAEHPIVGDIVQIPSERIPKHDVLLAGFPCQPFSIAGVSKKNALGRPHGFADDTQGTLFFEVARIIHHRQPRAFLLENVKNLTSHDRGHTFKVILKTLREDLGYKVQARIINARSFVPQHRERIIIVGFKEDAGFDIDNIGIPALDQGPRLGSILHPEDGSEAPESPYTDALGRVASRYRLTEHLWQYLQNYAAKHKAKGNGFGFGLVGPEDVTRTLSARYYKDGSEILVRTGEDTPRRLTPRECARLMGFDRPGVPPMIIPVSDTQAYKQFGNSVVVPVIEAVAKPMIDHLLGRAEPCSKLDFFQAVA